MSRFVNREATDRIIMDNGDVVNVRQGLTAKEQAELNANLVSLEYNPNQAEPRFTAGDWHLQRIRMCQAFIVSWDFKDDEGKIVDYRPELVEQLDDNTIGEIAEKIDKLQAERDKQYQKKMKRS